MYNRHELTLWTDELVFARGAVSEQIERYSKQWRKLHINGDTDIGDVYLPAIRACQSVLQEMDKQLLTHRS